MRDGVLYLNGAAVPREDLGEVSFTDEHGGSIHGQGIRETLPDGASYVVIDRGLPNSMKHANMSCLRDTCS